MVFCDVSKAFDRVWHKGLLLKLEKYGIRGSLLNWLTDYISNRSQSVFVNGALSKPRYLQAGVPQGSVLGPFLFLVYVNDIADELDCLTRLFADDSSLGLASHDRLIIERELNLNLERLRAWAKRWLITFNPDKTEAIIFSFQKNVDSLHLYFNGVRVKTVDNHKHLGLTFSKDCKWSGHIHNVVKITSRMISSLRKLKFLLPRSILNKIYVMFIRPHFEYACEVWDGCAQYQAKKLEQLQLEAARIVTGLPKYTQHEYLYYETGWETLAERKRKRKLCLFYKIQNNMTPSYLNDLVF